MAKEEISRLDKVLSNNGFGTRSRVKGMLHKMCVSVNGNVVTDGKTRVNTLTDVISVDGIPLEIKKELYIMMNKSAGSVCSARSGMHLTVFSFLEDEAERRFERGELSSIGRLDADTEGLLILTTDGMLNHKITSPKSGIPKTYLVYLRDAVDSATKDSYKEKLSKGVHIAAEGKDGEADCLPAILEWGNGGFTDERGQNEDGSLKVDCKEVCTLTVFEGKFHEVKRLFAALGNEVVYLKRIKMNELELDKNLKSGEYRELTDDELNLLRKGLKSDD